MEKERNSRAIIESDLANKLLSIDGECLELDDSLTSAGPDPDIGGSYLLKYRAHENYEAALEFAIEEGENIFNLMTGLGYRTHSICQNVSEGEGPYVPEVSIGYGKQ